MATSLTTALAGEEEKLLACIHCGLCLEACPTYVITGNENDGPRGRLYLMRAVAEGRLENTSSAFQTHIDRCLGCRACEQVCPAGVEYGQLLEASREVLLRGAAEVRLCQQAFAVCVAPRLVIAAALAIVLCRVATVSRSRSGSTAFEIRSGARRISPRAEFALALLESSRPIFRSARITPRKPISTAENVLLFSGCVGEGLFARVNRATERVLRANNFNVSTPKDQVCCGALHAHAGDLEGARELARKNIAAFNSDAPIVTNAGGCGAMLTTYGHLFANDEDLAAASGRASAPECATSVSNSRPPECGPLRAPVESPVTYDTSCHLLYGQRTGEARKECCGPWQAITSSRSMALKDVAALPVSITCCSPTCRSAS